MSRLEADLLQRILEQQNTLTGTHESRVQRLVAQWRAMRENDRDALARLTNWPSDRKLFIDPLPGKIADTFADLLYGNDPVFTAAETQAEQEARDASDETEETTDEEVPSKTPPPEGEQTEDEEAESKQPQPERAELEQGESAANDQERLDELVKANAMSQELHQAERIKTSEGEVWYRIYKDRFQSDYPIIEWHSRSEVRPLFRGRKLIACAFFRIVHTEEEEVGGEQITSTWRYVEIHAEGYVRNLLYKGTVVELGTSQDLNTQPETSILQPEWNHELGMLAGRVINDIAQDRRYGVSDFQGIKDLLDELNEATTVGHENMRLTAKKRAVVPSSAVRGKEFDAGEDVLINEELDTELGDAKPVFTVLEYSFDAQALIAYKTDVAGTALTRVGIMPQFINAAGPQSDGGALSGTALRVRLIPTTLAGRGKERPWDDELPNVMMLAQQLDAMPEERGGFGRSWNNAEEPPAIERGDPLPTDMVEETTRHATAVQAEIESRWQAIRELHPDWDDDQVDEELQKILDEQEQFGPPEPALPFGGGGFGQEPPPPGEEPPPVEEGPPETS